MTITPTKKKLTSILFATPITVMATIVIFASSMLTSCTEDDDNENSKEYKGVPLVILDTDIGSSTDDLFCMEMLYRYADQGRCKLLGIVVDREGEDCAACADVMNTYFGYGNLPIGLVREGIPNPTVFINYQALPNCQKADGSPMFNRSVSDYSSLPDGWQLYRRLLAAQPDKSVSICSVGFVTCLSQLLESGPDNYSNLSGVELVRSKVKCLYLMGGSFPRAVEPDYNLGQGISFSQTFFRLWPSDVEIIFSPGEVGDNIDYLPEQVLADISWTDEHPIKQVYMTCECDAGQRMWDPLTAINAIEGNGLFMLSERGTVSYTSTGKTIFTVSATGNCRYQFSGDNTWNSTMLEKIRNVNMMR